MIEILMPEVAEGVTEATIVHWNVEVGQHVTKGELLFEVMTDKATLEVDAQSDGTIVEILVPADTEARVGTPVARIKPGSGS
jgi:pyruvate/2-oxoglutarate dehydrogenase complex dihydrolipoamide acyltransferase (E2) component